MKIKYKKNNHKTTAYHAPKPEPNSISNTCPGKRGQENADTHIAPEPSYCREQRAIRHEQYKHPAKLKSRSMLEGVVPPFPTSNYGLNTTRSAPDYLSLRQRQESHDVIDLLRLRLASG